MSYTWLAIYFATSHFRNKKTHSLQSANEEKPTYKRINVTPMPVDVYPLIFVIQLLEDLEYIT